MQEIGSNKLILYTYIFSMVILDVTCDLYEAFPGAGNDPLEGDDGLGHLLDHVDPAALQPHHLPRVRVPNIHTLPKISRAWYLYHIVAQNALHTVHVCRKTGFFWGGGGRTTFHHCCRCKQMT